MNIKKIIASAAASALAVSAMAVAASAGNVTASIPFKNDGNNNWQLFLAGDAAIAEAADIDFTKVASAEITLTFDTSKGEEAWAGGAVVLQSDALGWNSLGEWESKTGNGKTFEGVESGKAFTVSFGDSRFAADDTYAAITLQSYGDDTNIDAITLKDESGAVLLSLPGAAAAPTADTTQAPASEAPAANAAPADDKGSPDTGVEGVAVVAALAVLAGGAIVVAKKRK